MNNIPHSKRAKSHIGLFLSITIVLGILLYVGINALQNRDSDIPPPRNEFPKVAAGNKALNAPTLPQPLSVANNADRANPRDLILKHNALSFGAIPYRDRVRLLLEQHPEINLSSEDGKIIQEIYTRFTFSRKNLEIALADIKQSGSTSIVSIPTYPNDGAQILSQFEREVREKTGVSQNINALMQLLVPAFVGDNSSLGQNPQNLTITINPSGGGYQIKHEVITLDPKTGSVSGIGHSINQVSSIEDSVYEGQSAFFPKNGK